MVFSSPVFLFLFLPLVLGLNFLLPRPMRNGWLLIASLLFFWWGEKAFTLVMLASIGMNYVFGLLAGRCRETDAGRWVIALAVAANLLLLIVFKYANFLVDGLDALLAVAGITPLRLEPVHLPIGISFFTFQAISYVIDVHRGHAEAKRNPLTVALYITLFFQLIAGPILRFRDVAGQIEQRSERVALFATGVRRFILGLSKKVLIANTLAVPADAIFGAGPADITTAAAWLGATCYALQIYFDFSGYSDMAIGLGKMFGFTFPENFNYPYIARSIREFWRRWHISLSTWFRDYLYIPLGGNRVSPARNYFNLVLVFFLCGLWHGASWTFVIWGLYHGLFLILERPGMMSKIERWPAVAHVYAALVVLVGWVFFRSETLPDALVFLGAMIGAVSPEATTHAAFHWAPHVQLAFFAGIIGSTPAPAKFSRWLHDRFAATPPARAAIETLQLGGLAALFLLSAMQLASGTYNPFIYFRF